MVSIAVDAMGGDFGPQPIVEGVVFALKERTDFEILLVGDKQQIESQLNTVDLDTHNIKDRIKIIHSSDAISMEDNATDVLKRKESSIYRAIELVKKGEAKAVVSAGHSGATMALATLRIGRLPNISRPAIATFVPQKEQNGSTLLLDVGANADCTPENLVEFAIMGSAYAHNVLKIKKPKIGLLSNGEEDSKGNKLTKSAFPILKELPHFVGNVEGADIFNGSTDVVVTDGFTGNIVLKTSESVAQLVGGLMKEQIKKSAIAKAGSLLMKKVFKMLKQKIDYAEYGGAPLLGLKSAVIISHGKSNPKAIKNAIFQAMSYVNADVEKEIASQISKRK
jgi:glycerol-3-phosphate acyltransferase PlsX